MKERLNTQRAKKALRYGISTLLVGAATACGATPEASPVVAKNTDTPTPESTKTPMPSATAVITTEATLVMATTEIEAAESVTPMPEATVIVGAPLTGEFLTNGLSNIGDSEPVIVVNGETEPSSANDLFEYSKANWNENGHEFADLAKDDVFALQYLLSAGPFAGVDNGVYRFPELVQLKDLTFYRNTISNLPSGANAEKIENGSPAETVLRAGTHMSVVGDFEDPAGRWTVVTIDESFDRNQSGIASREIPRQYFVVLSQDYLKSLLRANNADFNDGIVSYRNEKGEQINWVANTLEPEFVQDILDEAGALWVDQKADGSWSPETVVPYPSDSVTGGTSGGVKQTEDGRIVAISWDGQKEIAEAIYSQETGWVWTAITETVAVVEATATPEVVVVEVTAMPEPTATVVPEQTKRDELIINPQYSETLSNGSITVTLLSDESLPDEMRVGVKSGREGDLLSFLEEKFVAPFRDGGRTFWATEENGKILPIETEIDWSRPIEIAWKRGSDGLIKMSNGPDEAWGFTFVERPDSSLRIIVYLPPVFFTDVEQTKELFPPEAFFSADIAFLEFLISNDEFIQGRKGYAPEELTNWFSGHNGDYDNRVYGRDTSEEVKTTSLTTFK